MGGKSETNAGVSSSACVAGNGQVGFRMRGKKRGDVEWTRRKRVRLDHWKERHKTPTFTDNLAMR